MEVTDCSSFEATAVVTSVGALYCSLQRLKLQRLAILDDADQNKRLDQFGFRELPEDAFATATKSERYYRIAFLHICMRRCIP